MRTGNADDDKNRPGYSMSELIRLGDYGWFVWGSYALVATALLWGYLAPILAERRLLTQLHQRYRARHTSD